MTKRYVIVKFSNVTMGAPSPIKKVDSGTYFLHTDGNFYKSLAPVQLQEGDSGGKRLFETELLAELEIAARIGANCIYSIESIYTDS